MNICLAFSVFILSQNAIFVAAKPAAKPAANSSIVDPVIMIDKSNTIDSYIIQNTKALKSLTGKTHFNEHLHSKIIKNLEDLIDVIKETNSSDYPKIVKFKLALLTEIDVNPLFDTMTLFNMLLGWYCITPQEIIRNIILDINFEIEDKLPENIKVFIKQYRFNRWQYIKNYCDNKDLKKKLRRDKKKLARQNHLKATLPSSMEFLIQINNKMGDFFQTDLIDPFDFIVPEKPKEINEEDIQEMEKNMDTIDKYDSDFYFDMYPKDFKHFHSQHKNAHLSRKLNIGRKNYPNKLLSRDINPNEDFSDAKKYPNFAENVDSAMNKNKYYQNRLYIHRSDMNYLYPQNESTFKEEASKDKESNQDNLYLIYQPSKIAYLSLYDEKLYNRKVNNYYFSRAIMTFFNWRDHYCYNLDLEKKDEKLGSPDKEWILKIDEMYLDKMDDKKKE